MSMKKYVIGVFLTLFFLSANGQAYQSLNIAPLEYNTYNSHEGIEVVSITPQSDGMYLVNFYNNNYNDPYDGSSYQTSYNFTWYLSYKGKRVSDYFDTTIRCRKSGEKTVYAWPGDVPKGYEKYVTVQFGREQKQIVKDRRDDY